MESLTAIVEHWDGRFELNEYTRFVQDYALDEEAMAIELPGESVVV